MAHAPRRRTSAAMRSCPRMSVMVCGLVDYRPAGTRHPDAVALDAAVQLAAVLVLKDEGFKGRADGGARGHSITRSARSRSVCGIVSPSAFAVLRLMTSANLVGCSTGRSAGLAPLRMRSTYVVERRHAFACSTL